MPMSQPLAIPAHRQYLLLDPIQHLAEILFFVRRGLDHILPRGFSGWADFSDRLHGGASHDRR